jgi:hypothetical protein
MLSKTKSDSELMTIVYKHNRPLFMSTEMEELKKCFAKLEVGQENLKGGQGALDAKMDLIDDALRKVKESVTGDVSFGVKGIAERLKEIEEKQKAYDKIYYKIMGVTLVIGVIWPILVTLLLKWLTSMFDK